MKNKTGSIIAIILLSLLACCLVFAMYLGIKHADISNLPSFGFIHEESQRLALDREFDFEDTKLIKIDSNDANINFTISDTDKISVKIFADESEIVNASKESDVLDISTKSACKVVCFGQKSNRIEVALPEKYENDFAVKADAGNINSENFTKAKFNIDSDATDINIPAAKIVTIKSDAGDIELGSIESISIKSDAGKIHINECYSDLQIKTDAGKIEIDELQLSKNSSIESDAGKIKIHNAGNAYINTRGSATKFNIQNNNRNAEIELLIDVDAGIVDVN